MQPAETSLYAHRTHTALAVQTIRSSRLVRAWAERASAVAAFVGDINHPSLMLRCLR